MKNFFSFSLAVVMAIMLFVPFNTPVQAQEVGRMFKVYDSNVLPAAITRLTGQIDTVHSNTGGYGRGIVQSLSLIGGDSLFFAVLIDSSTTTVAANGITPRVMLEARAAFDSLAEGANNNYGYYNMFSNNPWIKADTLGKRTIGGVQDTLHLVGFNLNNLNKTGQIEYRFRTVVYDTGTSTTRQINLRWQIYGARPY